MLEVPYNVPEIEPRPVADKEMAYPLHYLSELPFIVLNFSSVRIVYQCPELSNQLSGSRWGWHIVRDLVCNPE